jgi:hypothetical protein
VPRYVVERVLPNAVAVLVAVLLAAPAGVEAAAPADLDLSFDGDGKRTLSYGGNDVARAVLTQPDGSASSCRPRRTRDPARCPAGAARPRSQS